MTCPRVTGRAQGLDLRQHLDTIERSLVQQALERSGGTVAHAARLLGLRRTTLVEKLRKFGEPAGERGGDLTGPVACRARTRSPKRPCI